MAQTANRIAALGLAAVAFAQSAPVAPADTFSPEPFRAQQVREASPVREETTVHGPDRELTGLVSWAAERFENSGLELPTLQIHIHNDAEPCGGHRGIYTPAEGRIDLCTDSRLVVLHELAHAWADENLTEEVRARYTAEMGLESWHDHETEWGDRGSEHAADTIAWGLDEEPIAFYTADGPIAELNDAFRMLTGTESPRLAG